MNRKYLILVGILILTLTVVLSGCSSPVDGLKQGVIKANRDSQVSMAKANQEMVKRLIEQYYVQNNAFPKDSDIQNMFSPGKTLESMKISVVYNSDGTVVIKNTNAELSTEEVPDLIFNPQNM